MAAALVRSPGRTNTELWSETLRNRYGSLLRVLLVLSGAAVGVDKPAQAQKITEFPLPNANSLPSGITLGPDGNLWFTETGNNKIGRITTAGVITEFPIPTANSQPNGITTGPDGALWFAETGAGPGLGGIGRMTTEGVFTEFRLSLTQSQPYGITSGPGGALWYTATERNGNRVGSITIGGQVGELLDGPPPGYIGVPFSIAAGPDGALWFAECAPQALPCTNSEIGRVTWQGNFTQYSAAGVSAYGIAVGPDGALWFTDGGAANKIGRITTAGAMTEFPVASGSLGGVTIGQDGALWFASALAGGNTIGRITTAGVATAIPVSGDPLNITTGPDGTLWFTENNANSIGRLALTTPQDLLVTPVANVDASGTKGVAFTPSSFSYTLTSPSGSVGFSISGVPNWLTASATSGTASSGSTVTFTVNPHALTLSAGTHVATIDFINTTNGQGTQTKAATLTVGALGAGTAGCSGSTPPTPATIKPGQTTQLNVTYYCIDGPGYITDPVTIAIGKLPRGASFSPKTTTTDITGKLGTTITITAGKTTPVGSYMLDVGGKGKACTSYSAQNTFCSEPLTIAPAN
jgi:virginiamycin B lyase